jgi:hypothetical protein
LSSRHFGKAALALTQLTIYTSSAPRFYAPHVYGVLASLSSSAMPKRLQSFALFLIVLILPWTVAPIWAEAAPPRQSDQAPATPPRVYVEDPPSALTAALELAAFTLVENPEQADVILLNGRVSDAERLAPLIRAGRGLVLILGPDLGAADLSTLLGRPVSLTPRDDAVSLKGTAGSADPLVSEIQWNSAPQVRARGDIRDVALSPLVSGFESNETVPFPFK